MLTISRPVYFDLHTEKEKHFITVLILTSHPNLESCLKRVLSGNSPYSTSNVPKKLVGATSVAANDEP